MAKLYYVGEFRIKRRIASIPVIWTFKRRGKLFCYWPLRNVLKKIEKCTPPPRINNSNSWEIFEIKILLNETMFHTLDEAEAKVNRIVDALTASENESFESSGTVSGNESSETNVLVTVDNSTIGAVGGDQFDGIDENGVAGDSQRDNINVTVANGAVGRGHCDDIEVKDNIVVTVGDGAVGGDQSDVIEFIGENGLAVDSQRDNINVTAANVAVVRGHREDIELKGNINVTVGNGAVGGDQFDGIEFIGENGAPGDCQRVNNNVTVANGTVDGSHNGDIELIGENGVAGDYQRDNINATIANGAVGRGHRDDIELKHNIDVTVGDGAVCGDQFDGIEFIGENVVAGGIGENGVAGGGVENSATGGGVENGAAGDGGEIAKEFVPWDELLPIGKNRSWNLSEHNLTDKQMIEDLKAFYRVIREKNEKALITKLIDDTFERKWFCENIGFCTYKNKIIFDKTKLIAVWIVMLKEKFCKDWTDIQVRNLLLANFTRYRNTYNKSKPKK